MWLKLEHLPEHIKDRQMFVVKAFDTPDAYSSGTYTSDPYCVWYEEGKFQRWPHEFEPTHFCLLPEGREV